MLEEKIKVIIKYLSDNFPDCDIEQDTKHELGKPWSFKIHLPNLTFLLLKIDDAFIKDNDIHEIISRFNLLHLTEKLRKNRNQGVLVS